MVAAALLAAALPATLMTACVGGSWNVGYYCGSFLLPAVFAGWIALIPQLTAPRIPSAADLKRIIASTAAVGVLIGSGLTGKNLLFTTHVASAWRNPRQPHPVTDAVRADYRSAQLSIPAGERILAVMDHAYLLDFKRNPIWIADLPGSAGLPPGMPTERGGMELAAYLRSKGVRYVMYSYERVFTEEYSRKTLKRLRRRRWTDTEIRHIIEFAKGIQELVPLKSHFRRGKLLVLDLDA